MSLYTFATASLISADDHKRRPIMDIGTMIRTIILCLACAFALSTLYSNQSTVETSAATIAALR